MKPKLSSRPSSRSSHSSVPQRVKVCPFHESESIKADQLPVVDYKDVRLMRRFISSYAKVQPRRRTGLCAKHQRQIAREIKRARYIALVPFVPQ